MIEIETLVGPLDDVGLASIGDLYGRVDKKYLHLAYLRHLFVENPYGWALHSFARDGDDIVGHCAVIPIRARVEGQPADSGKVEAYVVDERYRRNRQRGGERSVALDLLTTVSDAAAERGIDPLHAYLTPRVGAIFERAGYRAETTNARPYVLVTGDAQREREAIARSLAAVQRAPSFVVRAALGAFGIAGAARSETVDERDSDLVSVSSSEHEWTIAGTDSWDWFLASGCLEAIELSGPRGARALLAADADAGPVHLLGWRPNRPGLTAALALVAALSRFAKERSAATLRIEPWQGGSDNAALVRACRLLALVPREPFTIYVRSTRPSLGTLQPSAFFYATF